MLVRNPDGAAELLAAVRCLAPLVHRHQPQFDRDRRLPPDVIHALTGSGLTRLWLPRALGGPELSMLEFMDVVEAVAELDGSVGWVVGNLGGMSRAGGYLPEDVARTWFADPAAAIAAVTGATGSAIPTEGGYRVTGRWPFASGIHHATRLMTLCAVPAPDGDGPGNAIACYLDPADVRVLDTWHVSGLRGTGSCDIEVCDVFVPAVHTHRFTDLKPQQPGLLYRLPAISVFALTVSVVPLGIARAAIAHFATLAGGKTRLGTSQPLAEREIVQAEMGRAEALRRSARALLVETIEELAAAADAGGERLIKARAMFRAACANAADTAVRVVDMMADAAGSAAIFETCALERFVRDVHAAVKHIAMSPNNYVLAGRICMGLPPHTARF